MSTRRMFRYTVPVDDNPWTFDLTSSPVHVANGATLDEVEFWAEHDDGAPKTARRCSARVTRCRRTPGGSAPARE